MSGNLINNRDIRKTKKVYIEWVDSSAIRGWQHESELTDERVKSLKISSTGYLIKNEKTFVVISTSVSESGCAMDPLTIPKCAITKLRIFK